MFVKRFLPDFPESSCNTYLLFDEKKNAVVIDPGDYYEQMPLGYDSNVKSYLREQGYVLRAILLSHGHYDHIKGVDCLYQEFHCPVYLHPADQALLRDVHLNAGWFLSQERVIVEAPTTPLKDRQVLPFFAEGIVVLHTPYHTPGSVCFYCPESKYLFSGDSLFFHGIGTVNLPLAEPQLIPAAIARFKTLPPEVRVFPGHSQETSLAEERKENPRFFEN